MKLSEKSEKWRALVKRIKFAKASQRLLPGAVRGLAQHIAVKNGFAINDSAGPDRDGRQNRVKFRKHHCPANVWTAGRELNAEPF